MRAAKRRRTKNAGGKRASAAASRSRIRIRVTTSTTPALNLSSGASHRTTFCEKLAVISDLFSANMVYFQRLDGVLKSRKTPVVMV